MSEPLACRVRFPPGHIAPRACDEARVALGIWRGKLIGRTIRLCFWRVPSVAVPQTAEQGVEWLDAQWERIDAWISAYASSPAHAASALKATPTADLQQRYKE